MKVAILECGHTAEVPDCCTEGVMTACPECPHPDDVPGVNQRISSIIAAAEPQE